MESGEFIRQARERNGLSQRQLALRAGTTQAAISRLERGERSPTIDTLRRLLLVMGEELDLGASRRTTRYDREALADALARPIAERLRRAGEWDAFAGAITGLATAAAAESEPET